MRIDIIIYLCRHRRRREAKTGSTQLYIYIVTLVPRVSFIFMPHCFLYIRVVCFVFDKMPALSYNTQLHTAGLCSMIYRVWVDDRCKADGKLIVLDCADFPRTFISGYLISASLYCIRRAGLSGFSLYIFNMLE